MKGFLKIAGRILLILAVAAAIVGATVAGSNATGLAAGDQAAMGERPIPPAGFEGRERPEGGERGGSGNPAHLIRNGLIMGLIVLLVGGGGWLLGRRKRKVDSSPHVEPSDGPPQVNLSKNSPA